MFNKKTKQISKLNQSIDNLVQNEKENVENFILILNQIQQLNNEKTTAKQKQISISNAISFAIETYTQKIVELDIDPQH